MKELLIELVKENLDFREQIEALKWENDALTKKATEYKEENDSLRKKISKMEESRPFKISGTDLVGVLGRKDNEDSKIPITTPEQRSIRP